MAQVNCSSPTTQHDAAVELAALRAKCARLQSERDKFKEALWTLRGNFSALQTHAETLELENGDLKDMVSMRGDFWDIKHAITEPQAVQEDLGESRGAAIADTPPSPLVTSATPDEATPSESVEKPVSTLPKPIMRMQQFVEGSSSPQASVGPAPSSVALTVGSMGPPPSPRQLLQFQPVPVGSPSSYKGTGKRQTTAKPKSASLGSSNSRELRSAKRSLEATPSPSSGQVFTKKARTDGPPHDIRSMISLPEDTDSALRAHFDSLLMPTPASGPGQSQETSSTSAGQPSLREECSPPGINTTQPSRFTPEPLSLSPIQQVVPPLANAHEQTPTIQTDELDNAMQIEAEAYHEAPAESGLATEEPQIPTEQDSTPSREPVAAIKPSVQENSIEPELDPTLDVSSGPTIPTMADSEDVSDTETRSVITVAPLSSAPGRADARPSASSSPAPSITSTRITRSSRSLSEGYNGKSRRAKTSWDPNTGKRIQVGPPRGKPKTPAPTKDPDSKRLVISIRPRNARTGSVRK